MTKTQICAALIGALLTPIAAHAAGPSPSTMAVTVRYTAPDGTVHEGCHDRGTQTSSPGACPK